MSDREEFVVVTTTLESEADARNLAHQIVEQRLAACVQTTPIQSVYRWQGAIETASEHRLVAKTRGALTERLVGFIRSEHSYEVPEIIVTPIVGGLDAYLQWIGEETVEQAGEAS